MTNDLDSDEISLLDLLVTMAQSWRLLVFGPLVAGLIGLGVAFGLPVTYQAEAKLLLPEDAGDAQSFTADVAMAVAGSDNFLLAVSQHAGLVGSAGDQEAIASMRQRLTTQVERKRLLVVRAVGPTPDKARALAQVAVEDLLRRSVPSGAHRQQIEIEIANARRSIQGYQAAQAAVSRWMVKPLPGDTTEAFVSAAVSLQAHTEAIENRIARLQKQLLGVGQDSVINKPNLPSQRTSPKRSRIAVLSALAAGFALLLWVFVRQAWRNAANQPETADKVKAVRAAFSARSPNRLS
jgi:uncharacterized protein involved in exopolysaccharide biosynthesis